MVALGAAALLSLSTAAISAPQPTMLAIKSYSDVAAAAQCLEHHYPWMIRIASDDVICLASPAGVAKRAVRAKDVISAAVRRVRGR